MKSGLAFALLLLFLCCATLSTAAPSSDSRSRCQSGCCNLGRTVFEGSCSSFANFFKNDADTAINESEEVFKARVARAPVPSSRCCTDARSYTQYGCACNSELMNAASGRGVSNNAVRVVGRATRYSVCASSSNGGPIQGGC